MSDPHPHLAEIQKHVMQAVGPAVADAYFTGYAVALAEAPRGAAPCGGHTLCGDCFDDVTAIVSNAQRWESKVRERIDELHVDELRLNKMPSLASAAMWRRLELERLLDGSTLL